MLLLLSSLHRYQDNNNHAAFQFLYYVAPTLRRDRLLRSSESMSEQDKLDLKNDFMRFLKDPKLRLERMGNMDEDRTLQTTAGAVVSRTVALFHRCQFWNNTLTQNIDFPFLAANGAVKINTAFADVTMTECLFKDNVYEFRRDGEVGREL
jgi:hypothetical protein